MLCGGLYFRPVGSNPTWFVIRESIVVSSDRCPCFTGTVICVGVLCDYGGQGRIWAAWCTFGMEESVVIAAAVAFSAVWLSWLHSPPSCSRPSRPLFLLVSPSEAVALYWCRSMSHLVIACFSRSWKLLLEREHISGRNRETTSQKSTFLVKSQPCIWLLPRLTLNMLCTGSYIMDPRLLDNTETVHREGETTKTMFLLWGVFNRKFKVCTASML